MKFQTQSVLHATAEAGISSCSRSCTCSCSSSTIDIGLDSSSSSSSSLSTSLLSSLTIVDDHNITTNNNSTSNNTNPSKPKPQHQSQHQHQFQQLEIATKEEDDLQDNSIHNATTVMVQQPQHHNKHLPAQHTSILRKSSRFFVSNANSNDSNESSYSTSPRPSTGQKVKGLWSPSVSVEGYQEDNHDILAETETAFRDNSDNTNNSHGCLSSPTTMTTKMTRRHSFRTIATTTSTTSTSLENVRDETLSCIFCYLPLADLLRAGRVSRRWRHEVHRNNQPQPRPTPTPTPILHLLWETVDATSFVEETYDSFLNIAKERHRESESKENIISPLLSLPQLHHYFSPPTITITKKPKHKKQKRTIQDPSQWARVQTGLALGRVLRSKTTAITAAAAVPVPVPSLPTSKTKSIAKPKAKPKPFAIRSLVLRNVGNKLSPDRLDDFLPASVLSSLRELTLEGLENLNDTHVHVLLLTALGNTTPITPTPATTATTARARATTTTTTTRGRQFSLSSSKTHRPRKGSGHCLLEALVLENCPKLTSKVLSSIAATCSHKRLRKLSLRGCPRIDSITALSDLLVTKLVVLDTTEKRSNGNVDGDGDASIEKKQGGTTKLVTAPPRRSALPRPKSGGVASLFAPPTPQPPNSLTKPKPAGVASLFAPPPPPPPPQSTYTSNRVGGERSSSPSKSSLASLFDLPGTSPTRMNNAESIRILPPPPPPLPPPTSLPRFGTKAAPPPPLLPPAAFSSSSSSSEQQQQQQQQHQHPIPPGSSLSMATTVSKRYHRHQRSLSNGKLPYPPGLLLVEDVQIQIPHLDPPIPRIHTSASMGSGSGNSNSTSASTSTSTSLRGSATVVGSLKNLDLRGTAVTPSGLANCLWALTHHQNNHHPSSSADHSWCKVWFEALHLGATALFVDGSQSAGNDDDEHNAHNNRHQHQHQLWTSSEDLARLETVLAMDEMEGETSSEGVSYYLTPGLAQS